MLIVDQKVVLFLQVIVVVGLPMVLSGVVLLWAAVRPRASIVD